MQRFVACKGRELVIVLGNHDLEVALPPVRNFLEKYLSNQITLNGSPVTDAPTSRGRVRWAIDGAGFACMVGGKRVLCVHGNENDGWNIVDYHQLMGVGRAQNRRMTPEAWSANAGTRMVIDLMNDIKKKHRFVDLLKPEAEAALPVLVALDPGVLTKVASWEAVGVLSTKVLTSIKSGLGLLGGEEEMEGETARSAEQLMVARHRADQQQILTQLAKVFGPSTSDGRQQRQEMRQRTIEGLLLQGEQDLALSSRCAGPNPLWTDQSLLGDHWYSGIVDTVSGWISNPVEALTRAIIGDPKEALRKALISFMKESKAFDESDPDAFIKEFQKEVGAGIDCLIAGHTHLRRDLPVGGMRYLNTGTWVGLMQFTPEMLDNPDTFSEIYEALQNGDTMEKLRAVELKTAGHKKLVFTSPTVAAIEPLAGGVEMRLMDARKDEIRSGEEA
ncbi:MAG: hypothetical protein HQL53_08850 [Magnetococcales bacterium]|nr:hypothetical protein [Magnetococcales bacterium]